MNQSECGVHNLLVLTSDCFIEDIFFADGDPLISRNLRHTSAHIALYQRLLQEFLYD